MNLGEAQLKTVNCKLLQIPSAKPYANANIFLQPTNLN